MSCPAGRCCVALTLLLVACSTPESPGRGEDQPESDAHDAAEGTDTAVDPLPDSRVLQDSGDRADRGDGPADRGDGAADRWAYPDEGPWWDRDLDGNRALDMDGLSAEMRETGADSTTGGDVRDECPFFVDGEETDIDEDGVLDCSDNCALYANPDQEDADNDGIGDPCDLDLVDLSLGLDGDTLCGRGARDGRGYCFFLRTLLEYLVVRGRLLLVADEQPVYGVFSPFSGTSAAVFAGWTGINEFSLCVLGSLEDGGDWECSGLAEERMRDRRYVDVAVGDEFCTLRPDGRARCRWNDVGFDYLDYLTDESFTQIATAERTLCGVRADDGRVVCREIWFWDECNLRSICDRVPERPECTCERALPPSWGISGALLEDGVGLVPDAAMTSISITREFGCGIVRDTGAIECWGEPDEPARLDAPRGPHIAVSVSEDYACAIDTDYNVDCWDHRRRWRLPHRMREIQTEWEMPCGIDMGHNVRCFF